jgi:hypothetical protein
LAVGSWLLAVGSWLLGCDCKVEVVGSTRGLKRICGTNELKLEGKFEHILAILKGLSCGYS